MLYLYLAVDLQKLVSDLQKPMKKVIITAFTSFIIITKGRNFIETRSFCTIVVTRHALQCLHCHGRRDSIHIPFFPFFPFQFSFPPRLQLLWLLLMNGLLKERSSFSNERTNEWTSGLAWCWSSDYESRSAFLFRASFVDRPIDFLLGGIIVT